GMGAGLGVGSLEPPLPVGVGDGLGAGLLLPGPPGEIGVLGSGPGAIVGAGSLGLGGPMGVGPVGVGPVGVERVGVGFGRAGGRAAAGGGPRVKRGQTWG